MTPDAAMRAAAARGIDLAHDCDESAEECECDGARLDEDGVRAGGHAPGDARCLARARHGACSHDRVRLGFVE
jgi:hypothetical protein